MRELAPAILKIVYTTLGVLDGGCQKILYDSITSSMELTKISVSSILATSVGKAKTRSKQFQSQSQSQTHSSKKISDSQREQLRQTIMSNEFFQTDVFYPPDPTGTQDYTLIVLAVKFEGKTHTAIWTDTSRNAPEGLISIAKAVQEIASK
jgi:hypothetical protein